MSNERKTNLFTKVPVESIPRNVFDLSHEVKFSGKFGFLYPVLCVEAMPGDTFRHRTSRFMRFAPLLAPVMHRVDVIEHTFFVPIRVICDHFEDFITGGQDGTSAPVLPYFTPAALEGVAGDLAEMEKGTLLDYLGCAISDGAGYAAYSTEHISILQVRAYNKVWNDWYRDPNFDAEKDLDVEVAGDVTVASYNAGLFNLQRHMWEKDIFTSALAEAQRGPQVLMPLDGSGSVTYSDPALITLGGVPAAGALTADVLGGLEVGGVPGAEMRNIASVNITTSDVSINDLRLALAMQSWAEASARGGYIYKDTVLAQYGAKVPDYRLQRSEYICGSRGPVVISEVLSTADTATVPVGDMAGHGVHVNKGNGCTYHCVEHGYIMTFVTVMPRTAYQQGLHRDFTRTNRFDWAFPKFAHLGEQAILSKEVFYSLDAADNAANQEEFGYTPRFAEYKFRNDRVSGDFRDTLAFWHLGRIFITRPTLDEIFTTMHEDGSASDEESFRRIFAVQDGTDYLWFQVYFHLTAKRPLPYFGVPRLLG